MKTTPAVAIFDIGKTNKKLFLFDEHYAILLEKTIQLHETIDEDGDACENLGALIHWVRQSIDELMELEHISILALNFSAYGASLVHIDNEGNPVAPLYNYLKPFPDELKENFYADYGGEINFSMETASPPLGNLNSGLQLYYLKKQKPELFKKIQVSLHLPQFISYLFTRTVCSDITSIGCHTAMWNFKQHHYHDWLYKENIVQKLAPVFPSDRLIKTNWNGKPLLCGIGLHDSSAALIPYLSVFKEPFLLLSTGTWCIGLNPFNQTALTAEELKEDCLCYMTYDGKPVKASRLFAGYEHERQTKKLSAHYQVAEDYYMQIAFDPAIIRKLTASSASGSTLPAKQLLAASRFETRDVSSFADYNEAYHQLMLDMIALQVVSIRLIADDGAVNKIFVDGGFGKNPVYMSLLAAAYPQAAVYAASLAQASAIGAAMAVHQHWNTNNYPADLIQLKLYADIEAIEI